MTIESFRRIKKPVALVFGLLVCIAFGLLLVYFSINQRGGEQKAPILSGYSQNAESLAVKFDSIEGKVYYVALPNVPGTLDLDSLRKESLPANVSLNSIIIPLAHEPFSGEYSIVLFIQGRYVELVRQSSIWLKNKFNFDRPGGYSILGRRSLQVHFPGMVELMPLSFTNKPKSVYVDPVSISKFSEINQAAGLLRKMWSEPIQQGPTSKSYTAFLEQTFEEKMREVRSGEFAVMCQGFRDLFIHASTAIPMLKVRAIEAYNYSPQIPDLITYGHSTAEVWVEHLGWVIFDPWLGIIVTQDGVPIGAEKLSKLASFNGISIVPIIDSVPRMYRGMSGEVIHNSFFPSTVKIGQFSCSNEGCSPGYAEYFKNIKVHEFHIKVEQGSD